MSLALLSSSRRRIMQEAYVHVCCWPFSLAWHALARRSTIAAKRIKDLIAESVDGVRKDAGSVTEVGATMKKVMSAVRARHT
ncbi:hypothetical protein [Burkholderia gladioli]|uniref:hypothetical protein n=1 Tax=Burkholderia gladioli TaxID=28095 RepID=UPI00163F8E69|nr:hypothetical protein [Burkholderia gladioli]